MDIAAMSMSLSTSRLQMEASTCIAKKAMDTAEINSEGLIQMLEAAQQVLPSENIIDVRA